MADYQSVGIIGAGAWGTALAIAARRAGRDVVLWAYERETVDEINHEHSNHIYLSGVALDREIRATAKVAEVAAADLLLMVVPSQFFRSVADEFARHVTQKPVIICTKGFEEDTGKLMSDVVAEALPEALPGVLAGPSFASEIARGMPAALTLATPQEVVGLRVANALGARSLRLYWSDDMLGAQLGGAVKNVLAIAAGIVAGRGLGSNAQAGLITRGFAELMRFGTAMGAKPETLMGLSGLGDLILTCSSEQSRNMSLGKALGEGKSPNDVLGARKSVSEGAHSAAAAVARAKTLGIELPICEAVRAILAGEADVDEAIASVLSRPFRGEADRLAVAPAPAARTRRPARNSG
ncbi:MULTISPECIES: NAD(P)H-dependent glycerol-3-phosphate dehydrogenase [Rhodomicrobium]|uniref:NAD(P)H-dependent glycerol-3-phosphate dehydrogenase n=1 Tax=Rhodomicrobium TaxID=1068 RepID=UPI000B4A6A55|nr:MULTISPECIES: NAD(P)H-dependent glycerol-3-phosphate dehydrogenase [Rhodomicrobium]